MKSILLLAFILVSCADLTTSGARVSIVESDGSLLEVQEFADSISAKHNCRFIGHVTADTALFPGSYSLTDNEVHTALRNQAAKMGANLVVANFYRKPAHGVGLLCPKEFVNQ